MPTSKTYTLILIIALVLIAGCKDSIEPIEVNKIDCFVTTLDNLTLSQKQQVAHLISYSALGEAIDITEVDAYDVIAFERTIYYLEECVGLK